MAAYFIKRLLLIIPTFVGITFVLFLITRLVPGGPVEEAINAHLFNPGRAAEDAALAEALVDVGRLRETRGAALRAGHDVCTPGRHG